MNNFQLPSKRVVWYFSKTLTYINCCVLLRDNQSGVLSFGIYIKVVRIQHHLNDICACTFNIMRKLFKDFLIY